MHNKSMKLNRDDSVDKALTLCLTHLGSILDVSSPSLVVDIHKGWLTNFNLS